MHAHAEQYGATIENCTVQEVKQQGALFHVTTDTRIALARTINFATGVFNHRPPLPKAAHDHGVATGLIRYCPVCDAYEVRNKQIAVLGKGGHAANEARFMRRYSPFVTLISPEGSVATTKQGIHVLESPMERLSLADSHLIVTLQSQATHRFDALYIALGTTPQSSLARGLRVQLSSEGHIAVDAKYRTSIDGAYAIGDVTEGLDQIAVAMSQGAIAATAIHNGFDETPAGGSDFVR